MLPCISLLFCPCWNQFFASSEHMIESFFFLFFNDLLYISYHKYAKIHQIDFLQITFYFVVKSRLSLLKTLTRGGFQKSLVLKWTNYSIWQVPHQPYYYNHILWYAKRVHRYHILFFSLVPSSEVPKLTRYGMVKFQTQA